MKKLCAIIIAIALCLALLPSVGNVKADSALFTADDIKSNTERFCKDFADRTSFTEAAKTTAEGIAAAFSKNEKLKVEVQTFDKSILLSKGFSHEEKVITSYNVAVSPVDFDSNKPTVLIVTNYANHYSQSDIFGGLGVEGALGTAATTVLTMLLADNLTSADYNLKFAFLSGTDEGNFGSEAYIDKYLTQDVICVINLERLGCGDTYYYTDEVVTPHGEYVASTAPESFKPFPEAGRVLLSGEVIEGVPYSHYANRGDIASFMSVGKSCIEFIGGSFKGLKDGEGSDVFVTNTELDTFENLVKYHPDYAEKLIEVADYIVTLTTGDGLKEAAQGAATSYKVYTHAWVAYVIGLGIIMILILILILVSSSFEKKYPVPEMPKIKIAVFGKEYEDFKEDEILIDIKRRDDNDIDPFEKK